MEAVPLQKTLLSPTKNKLLRILGIGFGLALTIGAVIGGGVLRMPGIIAGHLGNAWLMLGMWLFGGMWALLGANVYSEIGTMLPEAGGPYVYLRRAYGEFAGFAGGFNDFFINVCGVAYVTINFAEFSTTLFATLAGKENIIAVSLILVLGVLNWTGLRVGNASQKIISLIKVIALFIVVVACFIYGGTVEDTMHASSTTFKSPFALFGGLMLSFQVISEAYAGWNSIVYFSEESTNPTRNVPRSMFGGILIIMAIYVLLNASLLFMLPVSQIASSKMPVTDATVLIFGTWGERSLRS